MKSSERSLVWSSVCWSVWSLFGNLCKDEVLLVNQILDQSHSHTVTWYVATLLEDHTCHIVIRMYQSNSFVLAILPTAVWWFYCQSYSVFCLLRPTNSTLCCVMAMIPILLSLVWWPSCQTILYGVMAIQQLYFVLCDPTISTMCCAVAIKKSLLHSDKLLTGNWFSAA